VFRGATGEQKLSAIVAKMKERGRGRPTVDMHLNRRMRK
jgi:hypothetical protein